MGITQHFQFHGDKQGWACAQKEIAERFYSNLPA
jgi:hypothetical protein